MDRSIGRDYLIVSVMVIASIFIAMEGKKTVEAEEAARRAKTQAQYAQSAGRKQAWLAAWKARRDGLTGPRRVFVPYQEPLPAILGGKPNNAAQKVADPFSEMMKPWRVLRGGYFGEEKAISAGIFSELVRE